MKDFILNCIGFTIAVTIILPLTVIFVSFQFLIIMVRIAWAESTRIGDELNLW